ncbi:NKL protein, partial [Alcedo cyanopectus]|nr:NKL protein [Ceyx cyanopectus]
GAGSGRGKKICSLCVKILEQVRETAGEDPDEAAVDSALGKVCRALGRRLSRVCKSLVKKYREKISEAVQNGEEPRDVCVAMGICKD